MHDSHSGASRYSRGHRFGEAIGTLHDGDSLVILRERAKNEMADLVHRTQRRICRRKVAFVR